MEIVHIKEKTNNGVFVRVSPTEALEIIQSLSSQLIAGNSVSGRKKSYTKKQEYFSIAVVEETT